MKTRLIILFVFFSLTESIGQLKVVPIPLAPASTSQKNYRSSRVNTETITLPFWEDFSTYLGQPDTALWVNSENVWVNDSYGVNPPSLNVASFDGMDQYGNPYSLDPNEVGVCDSLVSKYIDLTKVPVSKQNSLYLSFYYEKAGEGELPDASDFLELQFKTVDNKWFRVWPDDPANLASDTQVFNRVMIQVPDTLVQSQFQFRFLSTGRKNGLFDVWNLDYIYLDKNRSLNDFDILDRAITNPPNSIFKGYTAIPLRQFLDKGQTMMDSTEIGIVNYETSQPVQGIEYSVNLKDNKSGNIIQKLIDKNALIINSEQYLDLKAGKPDISLIQDLANGPEDSLSLQLEYYVDTGDTLLIDEINPTTNDTTYIPDIDLRVNDTIRRNFILHNYYAYDDGSAEFGAGVNQSGGRLVYRFVLNEPDTLVGVNIYFPNIGGSITGLPIDLEIYSDLDNASSSLKYTQPFVVQTSLIDQYQSYMFSESVPVRDTIFVGFKQSTNNFIPVGLDKNTDSGNQIFFNVDGTWKENTDVSGSLMIRPVFGKGTPVTSIEPESQFSIYPNPSSGTFFVSNAPKSVEIFDLRGRAVYFEQNSYDGVLEIHLPDFIPGLYLVRLTTGNRTEVRKIILR